MISALAGFVTSYYFYREQQLMGGIAFGIEVIQIFDKSDMQSRESPPKINIIDDQGKLIENNVYVANVTIWNSGNAEIRKEDIRVPLKISIADRPRILEITPIFFSSESVDKFTLHDDGTISWDHFDPGQGFKVKIIYEADEFKEISLSAFIVNIRGFWDYDTWASTLRHSRLNFVFWSMVVLGPMLLLAVAFALSYPSKWPQRLVVASLSAFFATIIIFLAELYQWPIVPKIPRPPF